VIDHRGNNVEDIFLRGRLRDYPVKAKAFVLTRILCRGDRHGIRHFIDFNFGAAAIALVRKSRATSHEDLNMRHAVGPEKTFPYPSPNKKK
jgi:hypothetical protein